MIDQHSILFEVVDSGWICSIEISDTFRSFLYMERNKNHEKNIYHHRAK